ncbi:hypothetical protein PF010_g21744 [Phytophthora fragariae]|uniref:Transmembrane protein n=1 Tax=Phytophthora fragariae TaxID=53985 RepID=A0A6A3ILF0_9STRA|nr:hypothetical protein PF011_g21044 [Phytophthora fragariae]KAE9082070.1 hypothetical protein PF010_g21744 [Phytophthora fragariae]KAE9192638.1 hypothetical protein PF004_g21249 [Phytophthora fragariae]
MKMTVQSKEKVARSLISSVFSRENQYVVAKPAKPKQKVSKWHAFNAVRRLVVIAAAFQYIYISMVATWRTVETLRSMPNPTETFEVFTASLIAGYIGDGPVHNSPLVRDVLDGDTTPRDYVVYLESETKTSTENCSDVPLFDPAIYNYAFMTRGYLSMVNDTSYNTTTLANLELVVVVVDCSFTPLVKGDPSTVRVFNLVRSREDPRDLYLVTVSLSAQDYEIREHTKEGPALLGILSVMQDMRLGIVEMFYMIALTYPYQRSPEFEIYAFVGITDDSFLELRSSPKDPLTQPVKHVRTARQRGLFDKDDQSNIRNTYTLLDASDAKKAITRWEWIGEAVISDSWAWVHGLHFIFGMQTIFSLIVLSLVTYQNFLAGKVWIGDPFASVSTASLVLRGVLVVISWYLNSFWTLFEFAMSNAAIISGTDIIHVHKELVHTDVLVVYLGLVALLSTAIRERIDPSIAIFLFEIIHKNRLSLIRGSPAVRNEVVSYSDSLFILGDPYVSPVVSAMSPFDYWAAFQIPRKDVTFLAASFFPKITFLGTIAFYAVLRKIYRYHFPEEIRQRSSQSAEQSANEKTALSLKGNLTNFEISTGAELQTRFGIISDYKNYVYFKGMKFASADGVYCSGYVIINGKFLIKSKALPAVVMIKLVRSRFTNVYVYSVDGNTVKDTARLVFPETFSWTDLWRLNLTVLL